MPVLATSWQNQYHIDGLVQERCNSIANALELCLSCTNQLIFLIHASCIYGILIVYCWSINNFKFKVQFSQPYFAALSNAIAAVSGVPCSKYNKLARSMSSTPRSACLLSRQIMAAASRDLQWTDLKVQIIFRHLQGMILTFLINS